MPVLRIVIFSLLAVVAPLANTAQNANADSILSEQLLTGSRLRALADSARNADSTEQMRLEEELLALRAGDLAAKVALQAQIDSLNKSRRRRDSIDRQRIDSLRASTVGVPVVFFGDTLLTIFNKLGPLSATERARNVTAKLESIADDPAFSPEAVRVFPSEESFDVMYNELILLTVNARDGFWLNQPAEALATSYAKTISEAVSAYQEDHGLYRTLLRVALLLIVATLLYVIVRLLNKGFSRLIRRIVRSSSKWLHGIKLREYEFLSPDRQLQLLLWILNLVKWLAILLIVYLALPAVFSIFPTTEGVARTLIGYITDPVINMVRAIVGFIPEMITIVVIAAATHYFVRFLRFLSHEVESGKLVLPGFYPDWAYPTFNLLRVLVYAFSFIIIFPYLPGSDSPIFQGVSVFLGLLLSLGSSSAISNIIAGLVITYMRPFKVGDRVKIGDTVGDVIEKNLLVTRLRTIKNEDISIPNGAILNGSTINFSANAQDLGLILHTTVTIGYDVPWNQVHDLLIQSALKAEWVERTPAPFVLQTSLDDFYVSYQLNAYTKHPDKSARTYSEIHSAIQDAFRDAGVEIMSPHYRAERDGSTTTIPPK